MHRYNEDELMIGTRKSQEYKEIFAKAGRRAAERARRRGFAVTYIKDGHIIQEYPDGEEKVLAKAPKQVKPIWSGVIKLQKNNTKTKINKVQKKHK
ncbi:MAG: hypothetical protein LBC64_06635 [Fibromonadaceae bacterium]|jgi:hypothetical protein|nr:hypothetical protein [Fibromonadaceae bacterium]